MTQWNDKKCCGACTFSHYLHPHPPPLQDAGIPQTATTFIWMYGVSDEVEVYVGGDQVPRGTDAAAEPQPGDTSPAAAGNKGEKNADRKKANGAVLLPKKVRGKKRVTLSNAVMNGVEYGFSDEVQSALRLILFGAYAYFDEYALPQPSLPQPLELTRRNGDVIAILSVRPSDSTEQALSFEGPKAWQPNYTRDLWRQGRFQPVTLPYFRGMGARWYCWVHPSEEIEGDIAGEPLWMVCPPGTGCFVYLFDPDSPEKYKPGIRPKNPPQAHPHDKYFPIRRRQTDTRLTIVMETMRPAISEENEFNDYTMIMLQFSYVACFASVLPLAPLVALLTGTIELHTDILKFLKLTQRSEAMKASGIGAWLTLLTAIIYISIPLNTLIVLKGEGKREYFGDEIEDNRVLYGVLITSCVSVIMRVIMALLPTTAGWVIQHELRRDYEKL